MIIWIDGTYGVGKTELAVRFEKRYNNCVVLEADDLWQKFKIKQAEEYQKRNIFFVGGDFATK